MLQKLSTLSSTLKALKYVVGAYKEWRPKGYFQFEIIINVLVSSFRFTWIPMLCVFKYGRYKYFNFLSAGTVFIGPSMYTSDSVV